MEKNTNIERTLVIVKPDGMPNIDKIIEMIYQKDLKIVDYKVTMLDPEVLKEHYSNVLDKPFYPTLEEFMTSSEVALMIVEGEDAVAKFGALRGPTDSRLAPEGTIRKAFGTDKTYNAVHGSDSVENAEIEINRFFNTKQKIK